MEARPRPTAPLRPSWGGYYAALGAIALVSGLSGLLAGHGRVADLYLLYLVGVLAVALAFGREPATLAAITAVLTADFFFVGPTHAFTLVAPRRYPTEWIELHVLLAATLLTGLLAGGYRQRARAALRASEERNHTLVRNTMEAISVFEPATKRVMEVNPAFLRLLGYTGAEATTLTLYDVVAHERAGVDAFVRRTLLQGTVADGEQAWRRKNGQLLDVQVTAAAIRNDGHEFCFFVGRDVTARRGVEKALRASEEWLHTLMTNAPVVLFSIDPAGVFTLSEGKGLAALGLRSGEVVGQSAFELYGDVPALVADVRRVLDGEAFTAIRQVADATFESWYAPLHGPDGVVRGAIGVSTDITARARSDAALRASEARFRAVFESAAVGMALVDLDGRPVASNPALQALLGYDTDELRGMTFAQCTHPDDVDADLALYRELAAGTREAYQLEKRYVRKDGAVLYGRLTVSLARDAAGVPQFAVGMVEDVTQYKRSSAELAEARRRLAEIREAERLRLARDLHDGAVQELYGIRFGLILSQRRAACKFS